MKTRIIPRSTQKSNLPEVGQAFRTQGSDEVNIRIDTADGRKAFPHAITHWFSISLTTFKMYFWEINEDFDLILLQPANGELVFEEVAR